MIIKKGIPSWAIYDNKCNIRHLSQVVIYCCNHELRTVSQKLMFFPYITSPGKFAVMKIKSVKALINDINGKFKISEFLLFDETLSIYEEYHVELHVIDERCYGTGVRFVLVQRKEYDELFNLKGVTPIKYKSSDGISSTIGNSSGFPFENIGVLMSIWLRTGSIHDSNINIRDMELIRKAIGTNGFGNRNRANCIGTNVYMGKRHIHSRSMASPMEGPCQSYKHQYYRSHYDALYQPYAEKLTFRLSHLALKHQQYFYFLMNHILPGGMDLDVIKSCRVKILTMGLKNKTIGFANELHVDKCDKIGQVECKNIDNLIKEGINQRNIEVLSMARYLEKWREMLYFSKATTCVYQMIQPVPATEKYEFIQYFIMRGLGCCVRLGSHVSHMFYASHFSHCTAVCILLQNDKIWFKHDMAYNVFAWGAS